MALLTTLLGCSHIPKPAVERSSSSKGPTATFHFQVSGMKCAACAKGLRSELVDTPGVLDATVDHGSGAVTIRGYAHKVDSKKLESVIVESGFAARRFSR